MTLGRFEGDELIVNLENKPVNVTGGQLAVDQWVTSAFGSSRPEGLASGQRYSSSTRRFPGGPAPESVKPLDPEAALAWYRGLPAAPEGPMFERRADFEAWDPTLVVLGSGADASVWGEIAARGRRR